MTRTRPVAVPAAVCVLLAGACSTGGDVPAAGRDGCLPVTALVASSFAPVLLDPAANPCADTWQVSSGSSTALAAQAREGAPADVFVSAGTASVDALAADGLTVGGAVQLGSVRGALVLAPSARIGSLRDLPGRVTAGWKVGLCVPSAPCGAMADSLLANAAKVWGGGFDRNEVAATEASSAEDLRAKVTTGEIDAAITYEYVCSPPADAEAAVGCVDIPDTVDGEPLNVRTPYVAVRLRPGGAAESFMRFVTSAPFREIIAERMRVS
ncbi:MAG: substrate-binding domain-containing protein [Ilumatobacteraceae bacterium]